ncbi:uncharacterized protein LOC141705453 [Apium graveolens]|uniref:uncharacterized protein LOC141676709 n=1 Tax=Apium graveolens TaxID=4045 RepID=UPI003D7A9D11
MGCFCSCFRVPHEEESDEVAVLNNETEGDVSNKQNSAPFSHLTQFFNTRYGVVSSNSGSQTSPASSQGAYIATTEVGTNMPRDTLLENSSSSGNLELQGYVAVRGSGAGLGRLQLEHGPPVGHNVQVKGPDIAATAVGTTTPQGTLLQNSSSSRNRELQGHVAVPENGKGLSPLQSEHGLTEGDNVQLNCCSKSKDKVNLCSEGKDKAGEFSKNNKTTARCSTSSANVSTEKVKTEHKDYFCLTRDEVECPTCLEEYTDENPKITSKCNHNFHLGCIYEWMERSTTCPICSEEMEFAENI